MRLFRYLLSLVANGIMTVVGAFLTGTGIFALFSTLSVYLYLETSIPGTDATLNDALGMANGGRMDLFAEAEPWLIMFGQLAVGVPLLFFGLRGLVRRIKAGLPDEDEGAAETSAGRIGQGLVYLAGSAVGGYLMFFTLLDTVDFIDHQSNSLYSEAVIERIAKSDGSNGEAPGLRYADFYFQTQEGETVRGRMQVPFNPGKEFVEGGKIVVGFLPSDPSVHEWQGLRSVDDYLINIAIYGALLLGGLWGAYRNVFAAPRMA